MWPFYKIILCYLNYYDWSDSTNLFQAKNWQKALELYEDIKSANLSPTVSTLNALITALCKYGFAYFYCLMIEA